ncbi:MAG TPA: segregation/condensation protein A [Myxococcales bacterium]|nr:segregation/condensation protein A [Myxococcales bacterium]
MAPPPASPSDAFRVSLPRFEGPLDLLLHLIREHKLDIFDIPVALITEKYLAALKTMREINLDVAGEFLVMASTLAHIKSRLLLPRQEVQGEAAEVEEAGDPRAELVRRLLEYQKYREAAETLARQDILDRDVFPRRVREEEVPLEEGELGVKEISIFKLIEALDRVLKAASPEVQHEVVRERVSLSDAIHRIADRLRAEGQVGFFSLFEGQRQRQQIVITFLALLEMAKLRLVRIFQEEGEEIVIRPRGDALADVEPTEVDEREYR